MLEIETGQPEQAARLLGAAQALRQRMSHALALVQQVEINAYVQRLRDGLAEADMERLWYEGRAMTLDEAVEFALSVSE